MTYRLVTVVHTSLCGDTYFDYLVKFAAKHDAGIDNTPLSDDEVENLLGKQIYKERLSHDDFHTMPF